MQRPPVACFDLPFGGQGKPLTEREKVQPARQVRGATLNPPCRFHARRAEPFDDGWNTADEAPAALRTRIALDQSRSIIARNRSPDVPFEASINPYRGCEHGCVYCFARPTHAYYDLSPGLDFESRLFVKADAAQLLRRELARPGYRCRTIALGANTDAYQPLERHRRVTRELLQVMLEHRQPVSIITKSALVERDLDLLAEMAQEGLAEVFVSITTLDRQLARRMEPRAAAPQRRLVTIERLRSAQVPVGVLVAPVIPVLTDPELETLLGAVSDAGALSAGYVLLRLPLEVSPLFRDWLAVHYPLKAGHVMAQVQDARGGRDYDATYGKRMRGTGDYARLIEQRFKLTARRLGLDRPMPSLDTHKFRVPAGQGEQMHLF